MNHELYNHKQYPPLWKINRASVFIEAMDIAAKTSHQRRARSSNKPVFDGLRRWQRALAARPQIFARPAGRLTWRFAAVGVGLVVLSGIFVANWVA